MIHTDTKCQIRKDKNYCSDCYKGYYNKHKVDIQKKALERYRSSEYRHSQEYRKRKKAYDKAYNQANKVQRRKLSDLWRLNNPERAKRIHSDVQLRRRARLMSVKNDGYDRLTVYRRFGGYCIVCDEKIDLRLKFPNLKSYTIHHLIPISKGGDNTINNVAPAHFTCNVSVGSKVPIAIIPKVLV